MRHPRRILAAKYPLGTIASAAAVLAAACADRTATDFTPSLFSIQIAAQTVAVAPKSVDVRVYYVHARDTITLHRADGLQVETATLTLSLDIRSCLSGPPRTSTCPIFIGVRMRDSSGLAVDSALIGPVLATPRGTVEQTVTLRAVASIVIQAPDTVFVGSTGSVQSVLKASDGSSITGRNPTWVSRDTSVLSISQIGVITARATGRTFVVATRDNIRDSAAIVVDGWQSVSAGAFAMCGVLVSGKAYCWGANTFGERGHGQRSLVVDMRPQRVGGTQLFTRIATYLMHTCGVSVAGDALCWGLNDHAELGAPPSTTPVCTTLSTFIGPDAPCSGTAVSVAGTTRFSDITVGSHAACAVATDGAAYCWGFGGYEAGTGDISPNVNASPVRVAGADLFTTITSAHQRVCAVTPAGAGFCWGRNDQGSTGGGTPAFPSTPTAVDGGHVFRAINTRGFRHTCAITTANVALCWGGNANGEGGFGVADAAAHLSPTPVTGGAQYSAIAAGGTHTCAIAVGGAAFCWGASASGALGTGNTQSSAAPVPVLGGLKFKDISASNGHTTCGVTTDGRAFCWGSQTGPNGSNSATPVQLVPPQ